MLQENRLSARKLNIKLPVGVTLKLMAQVGRAFKILERIGPVACMPESQKLLDWHPVWSPLGNIGSRICLDMLAV